LFNRIKNKAIENRLEFRHLTVLLLILVSFQIILVFTQKSSLHDFLERTQKWYKKDIAERIANLTTTSLEMIVENKGAKKNISTEEKNSIIQSFNIILTQQMLEQNVEKVCLFLERDQRSYLVENGASIYNLLFNNSLKKSVDSVKYSDAITIYESIKDSIRVNEHIYTSFTDEKSFDIFVPFTPNGEYNGCLYMKNRINIANLAGKFLSSYDQIAIIYTSLILLGLLGMYYISSFTLKERDIVQENLYKEKEVHLKDRINHEKESSFTKRIYKTHHKAEKIMGFIKDDLRELNTENIDEIKFRVTKYANFISRVIYDMKWYDPPVQTIRGPIFKTNINELITFIVENIFYRVSTSLPGVKIITELDERIPTIHINEFVIWEILEPLIQNCIDHGNKDNLNILVKTQYDETLEQSKIIITDDGKGILKELLEPNEFGIKKIFEENISTKGVEPHSSGYGCFIAYHLSTKRCKWEIDAENNDSGGAKFKITI